MAAVQPGVICDGPAAAIQVRLNMVKGIASVMHYLHSCSPVMIHGNLISSSILVDANFHAKVRAPQPSPSTRPEPQTAGVDAGVLDRFDARRTNSP